MEKTKPVSEIKVARFDAIVVAGGQAPMFSFEKATDLHKKFVEFYEAGKIACALCHGVALLRYAKLSNGELLAKGKTVTGNREPHHRNARALSGSAGTRSRFPTSGALCSSCRTRAALARRLGVSRAWVTKALRHLPPRQESEATE